MSENRPVKITIDADDYYAKYVGQMSSGKQFFLTNPFEPALPNSEGSEYIALYVFDENGDLLDAKIEDFGPRAEMDEEKHKQAKDRYLESLGLIEFGRIEVAPFEIDHFNTKFGLVVREPEDEDEDDVYAVEVQPGNYMAFFEPWDSGEYDT